MQAARLASVGRYVVDLFALHFSKLITGPWFLQASSIAFSPPSEIVGSKAN